MRHSLGKIGLMCIALVFAVGAVCSAVDQTQYLNMVGQRELVVKRGLTPEARGCIECHAKKTPGIAESWKHSGMAHASISCYDCHVVEKTSPMASQCEGVKGTDTFISPMVSSKTCSRCHPQEVEQFLKSAPGFFVERL